MDALNYKDTLDHIARSHTHHPDGKGPVCRFSTKKECDAFFRQYTQDKKEEYDRLMAERASAKKADRIQRFDSFSIASEKARMDAACKPNTPTNTEPGGWRGLLADGEGDTFGPGHPNPPTLITKLREGKDPKKDEQEEPLDP